MERDIRTVLKEDKNLSAEQMPEGHEARFMKKLDKALPKKEKSSWQWLKLVAGLVVFLGLGFGAITYFYSEKPNTQIVQVEPELKTLGDVSPELKKVEDYYMASINLELSKVKYTPQSKALLDGYLQELNALNEEYKTLSEELTASGPNELLVNALIDNLKFRLNLLYKMREQLKSVEPMNLESNQSI